MPEDADLDRNFAEVEDPGMPGINNAMLLNEVRSFSQIGAGQRYVLKFTLSEGQILWWKFKGFHKLMGGDIGFSIAKQVLACTISSHDYTYTPVCLSS
jgi:hypothetical protein